MAEGYIEMGVLNLAICNEFHQVDNEVTITYENKLKGDVKSDGSKRVQDKNYSKSK